MTAAPWVKCTRCGHERRHHGNTETPSSECHASVIDPDAFADGEAMRRNCDCPAYAAPDLRTPADVVGEVENVIKPAIAAAIAEDLAADE